MSNSIRHGKQRKCFKFVAIGDRLAFPYMDRGTSRHKGSAYEKRLLAKAERRNGKFLSSNADAA